MRILTACFPKLTAHSSRTANPVESDSASAAGHRLSVCDIAFTFFTVTILLDSFPVFFYISNTHSRDVGTYMVKVASWRSFAVQAQETCDSRRYGGLFFFCP